MSKNELTISEKQAFPLAAQEEVSSLREVIEENLDGESFSPFLLPQLKVPRDNSKWIVESMSGDESLTPTFDAIILYKRLHRNYYASNEIKEEPPDCASSDMITGVGDPGGACAECPLAAPGSSDTGTMASACKTRMLMFLLLPGRPLPMTLDVGPSCLSPMKQYLARTLCARGLSYRHAITRFGLNQKQSPTPHYVVAPSLARPLSAEELQSVSEYAKGFQTLFTAPLSPVAHPAAAEPAAD